MLGKCPSHTSCSTYWGSNQIPFSIDWTPNTASPLLLRLARFAVTSAGVATQWAKAVHAGHQMSGTAQWHGMKTGLSGCTRDNATQHRGKVQSCNKSPSGGAQRLQALGCHATQSVLCPKCCCCSSPGGAEQPHAMPALDPNPAAGYPSPQSTEFLRQALRHTQGHASSNAKLHVAALRACFKSVEHVPYCSNNQEVTLNAEWFPCT